MPLSLASSELELKSTSSESDLCFETASPPLQPPLPQTPPRHKSCARETASCTSPPDVLGAGRVNESRSPRLPKLIEAAEVGNAHVSDICHKTGARHEHEAEGRRHPTHRDTHGTHAHPHGPRRSQGHGAHRRAPRCLPGAASTTTEGLDLGLGAILDVVQTYIKRRCRDTPARSEAAPFMAPTTLFRLCKQDKGCTAKREGVRGH